jgi:hypothetical protein
MSNSDNGIMSIPSRHSVDETVEIFTRMLAANSITLFATIDHSGEARKASFEMRPTKLLTVAYPEPLIAPMRADLTRYGVEEARTPADVDRILAEPGVVLMVINSVCGCAAGKARPGIGLALQHPVRPDKAATVFAAGDEVPWRTCAGFWRRTHRLLPPLLCSATAGRFT